MKPTAYLCTGSDCKRYKAERQAIAKALHGKAHIELVGCQKVCKGQVVGVEQEGELLWFRRVNSKSLVKSLRKLVRRGRLNEELAARLVAKRVGKLR